MCGGDQNLAPLSCGVVSGLPRYSNSLYPLVPGGLRRGGVRAPHPATQMLLEVTSLGDGVRGGWAWDYETDAYLLWGAQPLGGYILELESCPIGTSGGGGELNFTRDSNTFSVVCGGGVLTPWRPEPPCTQAPDQLWYYLPTIFFLWIPPLG